MDAALTSSLLRAGVRVTAFTRKRQANSPGIGFWDPDARQIEEQRLDGADAIINLAGESLADGRWTDARKRRLWASRVDSTALIASALLRLERKPLVWINALGRRYYGNRIEEAVYEESTPGTGFLAELCQAWEAATEPAALAGIRVVQMRFGVILSTKGGALPEAAAPVPPRPRRPARQRRAAHAVDHARRRRVRHALRGAPSRRVGSGQRRRARTDHERAVHRGARQRAAPADRAVGAGFALKAVLGGEMAQEMLLTGANVRPRKLEIAGYRFEHPPLDDALEALLK